MPDNQIISSFASTPRRSPSIEEDLISVDAFEPPKPGKLLRIDHELSLFLNYRVIAGLNALRALAIGLVFIDHFRLIDHIFHVRLELGWFGVMIFFVLSGFLISSLLLKEYERTTAISLSSFYARRAYRIFPTFYLCWVLTTLVESFAHQFYWKTSVVSFFYLMDYGRALAPERLQPTLHMWISWSLAVEEKFYLLWPPLLLLLLKKRKLVMPAATIILGQWIYRAVMYLHFKVRWAYIYGAFDMRLDALLIGSLLAILVHQDALRLHCCNVLRWQVLSFIPPAALIWIAISPPSNKAAFIFVWSVEPVIAAIMLLQAVYWGSKSWKFCDNFFISWIAQLSYALYLYHPLASQIVYILHLHHLGYYAVLLTLIMAIGSYYLIEKPFLRLRDLRRPVGMARS